MKLSFEEKKHFLLIGLFFSVWSLIAGGMAIHHFYFIDSDLKDSNRRKDIQKQFEIDFRNIETPPKTAVNRWNSFEKDGVSVSLSARYRSELNSDEIFTHFKKQLEKLGWRYVGNDYSSSYTKTQIYHKGKFEVSFSLESNIFSDADYYQLSFYFPKKHS